MQENGRDTVDPRIRRTRLLLQQALGKLLETKEFDKISVQDIAEAATVNRATFYDHYTDKFALLECLVGTRFGELLAARGVRFDGVSPEIFAATVSWAIFGAAKEWVRTPERGPSEEMVETVMRLVGPMFGAAYAGR